MASLKIFGRSRAEDLHRTAGDPLDEGNGDWDDGDWDDGDWNDGDWDDTASARRPGLGDLLKGAGLALAAGALIVVAVVGAVITLVVVSLGPTHRHGPGTGRHSRHLPVSIAPSSDLGDGESVRVRTSRLAGAGDAVIAQCGAGADSRDQGVALCDLAHRSRVPVRRGKVETTFSLSRSITLRDGRRLNCGTDPGRCVLMVASAENYDRSGFAALSFLHVPT